ncbi:hypothetical protein SACS_1480 [Parasaccharibacter apium]|uniref:Uncharacterized protein n=1 Tax=Parasaccharibacter apium TaxID=1510841 RepID=A0A7U7G6W2_9PROT|nr:hypothetical protein SACS_1480 [Parasaccharibacter apium]
MQKSHHVQSTGHGTTRRPGAPTGMFDNMPFFYPIVTRNGTPCPLFS